MISDFKKDLARYPRSSFVVQPALWAIAVYRLGRWSLACPKPLRRPVHVVYFVLYSIVRLATGIDIPRSAVIGPGLMIHHFGGVIIHPEAVLGADCTLRQGVTVGKRRDSDPVPVVGDRVTFGAYAQVLGNIHVGSGATIGAMSVVLKDVKPNATIVGNPGYDVNERKLAD